ncbi:hypothetical protein D3C85_1074940 [compost metagenome]
MGYSVGDSVARGRLAVFGAQRFEQVRQTVVIDLLHQGQQAAQLAMGETLPGEPVQVRAGQVGNDSTLVLAEGHFAGDQQFELFRVHQSVVLIQSVWKIQAFCMQAK